MPDTSSSTDGGQQQQTGGDGATPTTGQQGSQQASGQQPASGDDGGKGGKDALLADLAKERDKRQELETQLQGFQQTQQQQMDAIAKALGLKDDEPDPAKLAEQATSAQQQARDAQLQLAVYRHAKAGGANPDALLDSASFLAAVGDVDPTKPDDVVTAIKAAVEKNPTLAAQRVTPGVGDAAASGSGASGKQNINDLIRAAAGH